MFSTVKFTPRSIFALVLSSLLFFAFQLPSIQAQSADMWSIVDNQKLEELDKLERPITATQYRAVALDLSATKAMLVEAPMRFTEAAKNEKLTIALPMPQGGFESFLIAESTTMHPDLAKKFPSIKTFAGHGIEDPTARVRLDYTEKGFHAMVMSDRHSTVFIDPYAKGTVDQYIVYYKKDFINIDGSFICEVESKINEVDDNATYEKVAGDCMLRTYRLALACTGEYAAYHGGTTAGAMSAMVTSMARVNGVFERDAGLTMVMIPNNDLIIFLNAGSDPYTNGNGGAMLGQNQSTCNSVIGSANYDIGHVFSTGGGGVASLNSPCSNNSKARGVTGQNTPEGDPFDIDYVAHEMGHQYGANHTQNNSCNRNNATAVEPGSASTIMGYAGICNPNVQNNSDDHFHAISIGEMANSITNGTPSNCPTTESVGNLPPTAMAGGDRTVPVSTPIVLKGLGSDPNGDVISYNWEQMDNEIATMPPQASNTGGPAFRSLPSSDSPDRYLPNLDAVLNGTTPTWEVLPAVSRVMDFRLTVRDNNGNVGCTAEDDIRLTFSGSAGPFLVQVPNTNLTWAGGSSQNVQWDVANTNSAPVSCANVDIWLSTDGGFAYDVLLASGVANSGSASITVPNMPGTNNRVMVVCSTSLFFDVSDENFTIDGAVTPSFTMSVDPVSQTVCTGVNATGYTINLNPFAGFNENIQLTTVADPGLNISFSSNNTPPVAPVTMTVANLNSLAPNTYSIEIFANSASVNISTEVFLTITPSTIGLSAVASGNDIVASITGGSGQVDYSIDGINFQSSNTFPGLPNGTYNITAQDQNGCLESVQVTVNALVLTVAIAQDINCNGANDGSITVNAVGGSGPFLYSNNSGPLQNSPTFSGLAPGGYIISVIDTDGFSTDTELIVLAQPPILEITATVVTDVITASANGGVGNFTYSLDGTNYQISPIFNNVANGQYTVYVMDDNGCIMTTMATVAVNSLVVTVANSNDVICFGDANGSLSVNVSGGSMPYQYSLDGVNYQNDNAFNNLTPGTYQVTVLDSDNFTMQTDPVIIGEPTIVSASAAVVDNQITVTAGGGAGNYSYSIDGTNFQSSNVFEMVANGTYTITVMDVANCPATTSATVSVNTLVATVANSADVSCFGFDDGSLTINVSGGNAPYTYSLDGITQQNENIFENLAPDTYTVTITDNDGFTIDADPVTIDEPTVISATATVATDQITIAASGGTGTLQYSIDGVNFQTSNFFENVANGVYTITVVDINDCSMTTMATVSVNNVTAAIATSEDVSCFGFDDGSLSALAGGGSEPYAYSINGVDFQSSNAFGDLTPGTYIVVIMDADGFTAQTDPVIIDEPTAISATASVTDNKITVNANGGTGTLQYSIDGVNFQASNVFDNLSNGVYTITVIDANDCSITTMATVSVNNVTAVIATSEDVSCFGFDDGSLSALAGGGSEPYTYSINGVDFQSGNAFGDLTPGTYSVVIMDADGFTAQTDPVIIDEPTAVSATASVTDNQITVTANGGTGTLQYSIDGVNFQASNVFDNLSNGVYTITVIDANDCSITTMATVSVNNVTAVIATSEDISCFGFDDGSISALAGGGSEPYTYSINGVDFQSGNAFGDLTPGTYSVVIMDADGFTAQTDPVIIDEPTAVSATASVADNQITVNANGGTGTLQYSIDGVNFQASNVFDNLSNGVYTITVIDANDCSITTMATVSVNNVTAVIATSEDISCFGFDDGSISALAGGGSEPYTYSINGVDFQSGNAFGDLTPGSYSVVIMDADGFTAQTDPVIIDEPTVVSATASVTDNQITVTANGGTGTLQYSIDGVNFQASNVFDNLPNGNYTITVIDVNDCSTTTMATVSVNNVTAVIATSEDVSCFGFDDGNLSAQASGGSEPYTYSINGVDFQSGNTFGNLSAGTYSVVIMDADGFTAQTDPVIIDEPTAVSATASVTDNQITVTANGGTETLQYSIDGVNFQASNVFDNLPNGNYTITVIDVNDCSTTTMATVSVNNVTAVIATSEDVSCFGFDDGSLNALASGGSEPYTYSINGVDFQSGNTFGNLTPGSYAVVIMDADGFTAQTDLVIIGEPMAIAASAAVDNNQITVTANGGTGTFQYSIDGVNFQASNVFDNLPNGNYIVTIIDSNDCSTTTTADIALNNLAVVIASTSDVSCFDLLDGSITVQATGGSSPYTYSIDGVNFQASNTFETLSDGTYIVTIMDSDGLTAQTNAIVINQPQPLFANADVVQDEITVTATGGSENYLYSINNGPLQASNVFSDLPNGNYTISIVDENDCSATISATVDVDILNGSVVLAQGVSCFGLSDGTISVEANGGTEPYAYSINGNDFQVSSLFTDLPAGTYTITVMDDDVNTFEIGPIMIAEPTEITATTTVNIDQITISANGGNGDYQYSLDGGVFQSNNIFNNVANGMHEITIEDGNGCSTTIFVEVSSEILMASATVLSPISCFNADDGVISINASGGVPPLSYSLDGINFQGSNTFENLDEGTYQPVVQDANGNIISTNSLVLTNPAELSIDLEISDGSVTIFADGGQAPFTYQINGGPTQSSNMFTGLPVGSYVATTIDANGCEIDANFTILFSNVIDRLDPISFNLYPNPNTGIFTIELSTSLSSATQLSIINVLGQVVYVEEMGISSGGINRNINIGEVAGGVYQVVIRNADSAGVKQIVVVD